MSNTQESPSQHDTSSPIPTTPETTQHQPPNTKTTNVGPRQLRHFASVALRLRRRMVLELERRSWQHQLHIAELRSHRWGDVVGHFACKTGASPNCITQYIILGSEACFTIGANPNCRFQIRHFLTHKPVLHMVGCQPARQTSLNPQRSASR